MDLDSRGRGPRIGGATAAGHARAGAMGVAAGAAGIPSRAAGAGVVTAHVGVRDAFGARARGAARFRARPQFGPGWNSFTRNGFGADGLAAGRGGPGPAGHVRTARARGWGAFRSGYRGRVYNIRRNFGAGIRGAALPSYFARRRLAIGFGQVRRDRRHLGSRTHARAGPGDFAAGRSGLNFRDRFGVRSCAGRVRGDVDVRRIAAGHHAHDAAADLFGAGTGSRPRAGTGAGVGSGCSGDRYSVGTVPAPQCEVGTVSGIEIQATVAARGVGLDVSIPAGRCTAILGPNGSGKSTLLGLISGLIKPSSGSVRIHGRVVADAGKFIPTHRREIGMLAQDPLLFPHLNVLQNVEFGLRARRAARDTGTGARDTTAAGRGVPATARDVTATARAHLAAIGCGDLAQNPGGAVSGGQAQRIALARALITDPEVLLLDEPLAALDAVSAPEMREVLREQLSGRTTALVTHDLLDVLVLAQHVVVLNEGRVIASGPTTEVLAHPRDPFLANFLGVNVLSGTLAGSELELAPDVRLQGVRASEVADGVGWASFPATAVTLHREMPHGSARNVLPATVRAIEPRGPVVRVGCDLAGQEVGVDVTPQSVAPLGVAVGERVLIAIKATAVALY